MNQVYRIIEYSLLPGVLCSSVDADPADIGDKPPIALVSRSSLTGQVE